LKKNQSEEFFIDGPVGKLEAILERPLEKSPIGNVVICHPHPQHGGTMHNKVTHTLARAFIKCGYNSIRFNFRGTENSDGRYDNGSGELDDLLAVIDWVRTEETNDILWLAGFSFGAAIAINASSVDNINGIVSIAPAVKNFSNLKVQPQCPWLIIQGDEDDLVDIKETIDWLNNLQPGPELLILSQAGHFFHGRLLELREAVSTFVCDVRA
tara:strand:- start:311 stop:946 length:636 start_codon:yes stop_codon:yes gene_type:complete